MDEAVVVIDSHEALATLGRGPWSCWIGRRPDDVIGPSSPWVATATPHDAMVARCDCSFEGCGSLTARIVRHGDVVVWDDFRHTSDSVAPTRSLDARTYEFDAAQYHAAVLGRADPTTWESTTRQAAMMATPLLRSLDLALHGFRMVSASHRGGDEVVVQAFTVPDAQRVTTCLAGEVRLHENESASDLANRVVQFVASGRFVAEAEVASQSRRRSTAASPTGQRTTDG